MFFSHPNKLPPELILKIISELSVKDAVNFMSTNTELRNIVNDKMLLKETGATSLDDFIERMKELPKDFQKLVLTEPSYSLSKAESMSAERLVQINKLRSLEEVLDALLTEEDRVNYRNQIISMWEEIKPELSAQPSVYLSTLKNLIRTLFDKSVTPQQVVMLGIGKWYPFFDISPKWLRNGNFSISKAIGMDQDELECIKNNFKVIEFSYGEKAIQEGLLTIDQVIQMPSGNLHLLLRENYSLLKEHILSAEQVIKIPNNVFRQLVERDASDPDKISLIDLVIDKVVPIEWLLTLSNNQREGLRKNYIAEYVRNKSITLEDYAQLPDEILRSGDAEYFDSSLVSYRIQKLINNTPGAQEVFEQLQLRGSSFDEDMTSRIANV